MVRSFFFIVLPFKDETPASSSLLLNEYIFSFIERKEDIFHSPTGDKFVLTLILHRKIDSNGPLKFAKFAINAVTSVENILRARPK